MLPLNCAFEDEGACRQYAFFWESVTGNSHVLIFFAAPHQNERGVARWFATLSGRFASSFGVCGWKPANLGPNRSENARSSPKCTKLAKFSCRIGHPFLDFRGSLVLHVRLRGWAWGYAQTAHLLPFLSIFRGSLKPLHLKPNLLKNCIFQCPLLCGRRPFRGIDFN